MNATHCNFQDVAQSIPLEAPSDRPRLPKGAARPREAYIRNLRDLRGLTKTIAANRLTLKCFSKRPVPVC